MNTTISFVPSPETHALIAEKICDWYWNGVSWLDGRDAVCHHERPFIHADLREYAIEAARGKGYFMEIASTERGYKPSVLAKTGHDLFDYACVSALIISDTKEEAELSALAEIASYLCKNEHKNEHKITPKQKRILAKFIICQQKSRNAALSVLQSDPDYESIMFLEYVYNIALNETDKHKESYIEAKLAAIMSVIDAVIEGQYKPINRPITVVNTTTVKNDELRNNS